MSIFFRSRKKCGTVLRPRLATLTSQGRPRSFTRTRIVRRDALRPALPCAALLPRRRLVLVVLVFIQRHDVIQKLEELSEGLELAVLGLVEVLELFLKSLRERVLKLGKCSLRRRLPRGPARAQVLHEELEGAHLVVITRLGREVELAEGLAKHFLVVSWVRANSCKRGESVNWEARAWLTRDILAEERPKDCGSHVHMDHRVCSLTKGFAEVLLVNPSAQSRRACLHGNSLLRVSPIHKHSADLRRRYHLLASI